MAKTLRRFIADENGATAIEYGLIVVMLSLAIVTGVGAAGDGIRWLWSDNNSRLVQGLQ
jgi:pilus assembly protein Flp/PilA